MAYIRRIDKPARFRRKNLAYPGRWRTHAKPARQGVFVQYIFVENNDYVDQFRPATSATKRNIYPNSSPRRTDRPPINPTRPVLAQKILQASREAENALADALVIIFS